MKLKVFTAVCLSALFMVGTQGTQAAAMKKTAKSVEVPLSFEKQLSPIEKALSQQKRDRSAKKSIDENAEIRKKLLSCAQMSSVLDREMQLVRDLIEKIN